MVDWLPSFHDLVNSYIWPLTLFFAFIATSIFLVLIIIRYFRDKKKLRMTQKKHTIEKKVLIHLQTPFDDLREIVLEEDDDIEILAEVVTALLRNLKGRTYDEVLSSMKKIGLYDWGLEKLDSISSQTKITAIQLMRHWEDTQVKEKFKTLLEDSNKMVSFAAIEGLAVTKDPMYLDDIMKQIKVREDLSAPLISDIFQNYESTISSRLMAFIRDYDLGVKIRVAAINALINLEIFLEAVPTALKITKDRNPSLRASGFRMLSLSGKTVSLDVYEEAAKDDYWLVRKYVADCLAHVEPMQVQILTLLLKDQNWLVSLSAGKSFLEFDQKGRKILEVVAEDESQASKRAKMILDEFN